MSNTPSSHTEVSRDNDVTSDQLPVDESNANTYVALSREALARAEDIVPDEDRTRQERAREKLPQTIGLPSGVSVEQVLSRDEHIRPRLWLAFHIASGASWHRIYDLIEKRLQEAEGEIRATHGTDRDPLFAEIHRIQNEIRTRREHEARTSFLDPRNATWQNIEVRQEAVRGVIREISNNIHVPVQVLNGLLSRPPTAEYAQSQIGNVITSLGATLDVGWEQIILAFERDLVKPPQYQTDRLYAAVTRSLIRKIDRYRGFYGISPPRSDGYAEAIPDTERPWSEEPPTLMSGL